uniref:Uncharacterized protein n=1 Tax=Anguilla anguilla TaxID=7936 RepID=A0A0E9UBQ6_ANGAN
MFMHTSFLYYYLVNYETINILRTITTNI